MRAGSEEPFAENIILQLYISRASDWIIAPYFPKNSQLRPRKAQISLLKTAGRTFYADGIFPKHF
jgi:hypothetical protein